MFCTGGRGRISCKLRFRRSIDSHHQDVTTRDRCSIPMYHVIPTATRRTCPTKLLGLDRTLFAACRPSLSNSQDSHHSPFSHSSPHPQSRPSSYHTSEMYEHLFLTRLLILIQNLHIFIHRTSVGTKTK